MTIPLAWGAVSWLPFYVGWPDYVGFVTGAPECFVSLLVGVTLGFWFAKATP